MVSIDSAGSIGIPSSIGSYGFPSYGVTGHYIGGSSVPWGSHSQCRAQVRGWHSYHKNVNGWAGIGYNWLICHHGIVMTGRGLKRIGAHNRVANATYQGICFMLGGSQEPNAAMLKAFRWLTGTYLKGKGVRSHNIKGHRDHISTTCPGSKIYSRVRSGDWGSGGSTDSVPGSRSTKSIQEAVNAAGYSPPLVVDGDYGPKTEAGVEWYQRLIGTAVDGDWGPNTEAAHLEYTKAEEEKEEDDVPLERTIRSYTPQAIPKETWTAVEFPAGEKLVRKDGSWTDIPAGETWVSLVTAESKSRVASIVITLEVDGLAPGEEMTGRVYTHDVEEDVRGYTFKATDLVSARGHLYGQFVWQGRLGAGHRPRLEVIHHSDGDAKIVYARSDAVYWER